MEMAVVDGYTGTFYIDPGRRYLKENAGKKEEDIKARELLQELKGKRRRNCRWKTHQIICKYRWRRRRCKRCNLLMMAAGIGLFRSEFLSGSR